MKRLSCLENNNKKTAIENRAKKSEWKKSPTNLSICNELFFQYFIVTDASQIYANLSHGKKYARFMPNFGLKKNKTRKNHI